jgi:hypothetical protein
MGRGARSAPIGVAMNPKRRVRAAHGRARAAKTHIIFLIPVLPELVECNFELENMRTVGRRSYQILFSDTDRTASQVTVAAVPVA